MNKWIVIGCVITVVGNVRAQQAAPQPVHWTYQVRQVTGNTYQLVMTAALDNGWHIYAQKQPPTAVAEPTTITYSQNPLIVLEGKPKEQGTMVHYKNDQVGIEQNQYDGKVSFVQLIKLKMTKVKTAIAGNIRFQVCTDKQCLPPEDIKFNVALSNALNETNSK